MLLIFFQLPLGVRQLVAQRTATKRIDFCDLVANLRSRTGGLFRVRATMVTGLFHGSWLTKEGCAGTIVPFVDCRKGADCSGKRSLLSKHSNFDGDFARVDVLLVGELESPADPLNPNSPFRFRIREILDVRKPKK